MKDSFGREIEYMRISVTDRCNMRCTYCMPEGCEKVSMEEILTYEEILEVCRAGVELGVRRFKITGGEPLVRPGCADLISMMRAIPGVEHITLTTNGALLKEKLLELLEAGVDGINISLDSLKPNRFKSITGGGSLKDVMEGLNAALRESRSRGGKPVIKINSLIQKGVNEDEVADLAELAFRNGISVRFIETMPLGYGDSDKCVSNDEILDVLKRKYPGLTEEVGNKPAEGDQGGNLYTGNGPAVYFGLPDRSGSIGFISAINHIFCRDCNRVRLTSQGRLKPCLCYDSGVDLKSILRREGSDVEGTLREAMERAIWEKPKEHAFGRKDEITEKKLMSQIGG